MTISARASVNAGADQSGGITIVDGDVVQPKLADYTGVGIILWKIVAYPEGFSTPTGWTAETGGFYWLGNASSGLIPPSIDFTGAPWGEYDFDVTINNGLSGSAIDLDATRDRTLGVLIVGPGGMVDVPATSNDLENRFETSRLVWGRIQKALRKVVARSLPAGTTEGETLQWDGSAWQPTTPTVINVKAPPYNAVGDGVTDDTAAFTDAIAALGSVGGVITMGPGTFVIDDSLDLDVLGQTVPITLEGAGINATTLDFRTAGADGIIGGLTQSKQGITIRNMRIMPAVGFWGATLGSTALASGESCPGLTLENVEFYGGYAAAHGARIYGAYRSWIDRVYARGCENGFRFAEMNAVNSGTITARECTAEFPIEIYRGRSWSIGQLYVESCYAGCVTFRDGGTGIQVAALYTENNNRDGATDYGVIIGEQGYSGATAFAGNPMRNTRINGIRQAAPSVEWSVGFLGHGRGTGTVLEIEQDRTPAAGGSLLIHSIDSAVDSGWSVANSSIKDGHEIDVSNVPTDHGVALVNVDTRWDDVIDPNGLVETIGGRLRRVIAHFRSDNGISINGEVLVGGDMEDYTNFSVTGAPTLSDSSADPYEGTYAMRVDGAGGEDAVQVCLVTGHTYHATGQARSDGSITGQCRHGSTTFATIAASASWQAIDETFAASSTTIRFRLVAPGWIEVDDWSLSDLNFGSWASLVTWTDGLTVTTPTATAAGTGSQPWLDPAGGSAFGGSAAVDFDGTTDWLDCDGIATGLSYARRVTIVAAIEVDAFTGSPVLLSVDDDAFAVGFDASGHVVVEAGGVTATSTETISTATAGVLAVVFDGTITDDTARVEAYLDGAALTMSATGLPAQLAATTAADIARRTTAANYFDGRVAELKVIRANIASERQALETAMSTEYGTP